MTQNPQAAPSLTFPLPFREKLPRPGAPTERAPPESRRARQGARRPKRADQIVSVQ